MSLGALNASINVRKSSINIPSLNECSVKLSKFCHIDYKDYLKRVKIVIQFILY